MSLRIEAPNFLVVTRQASADLRGMLDNRQCSEDGIRAVVLAAIRDGKMRRTFWDERGQVRVIDVRLGLGGRRARLELVWGTDKVGKPKPSPDRRGQAIFLTKAEGLGGVEPAV